MSTRDNSKVSPFRCVCAPCMGEEMDPEFTVKGVLPWGFVQGLCVCVVLRVLVARRTESMVPPWRPTGV